MLRGPPLLMAILLSLLAAAALPPAHAQTPAVITYPRYPALHQAPLEYAVALLKLALEKSGKPFELRESAQLMVQTRALHEIRRGGMIDVMWTMTTRQREAEMLPIRIPIDRGLIGWRIALLDSQHARLLRDVKSVADLAQFSAGQMSDWPDALILQQNGLPVDVAASYEGLFRQLNVGRIDYFPRSVMEIQAELASRGALPLTIDRALLIRYPAATYFFVARHQVELARDIEAGLEKALADGSFDELFQRHFGQLANELGLGKRRLLELDNPGLPAETPLQRKQLWYRPAPARQAPVQQ